MKKLTVGCAFLSFVFVATAASAQNALPTSKLSWTQAGPDLATVGAYTYKYYADGATMGVTYPTSVICSASGTTFTCVVNIPVFTQGNHSITMTASSQGGESAKSAPLAFTFISVPNAPTAFHLIP